MINVVIVDDHPIVRQGLAQLLKQEADLRVCGEAEDGATALRLVEQLSPQLVIVDLSLKSGDGIDLIKALRAARPTLPILVLSMHDEIHFVERALRAGALGYLTKQEASTKVLAAIRHVLCGEIFLSDRVAPSLLKRLFSPSSDENDPVVGRLTDREMQVFRSDRRRTRHAGDRRSAGTECEDDRDVPGSHQREVRPSRFAEARPVRDSLDALAGSKENLIIGVFLTLPSGKTPINATNSLSCRRPQQHA